MMSMKEKLLEAIDHCLQEDGCEGCPMLDDFCDIPFIPEVSLPLPLVEAVRDELREVKHNA